MALRNKRGPKLKQLLKSYISPALNYEYAAGRYYPPSIFRDHRPMIRYYPGTGLEYITLHEWGHMVNGDQGRLWQSRSLVIDTEKKAWLTASTFVEEARLAKFLEVANAALGSYDGNSLTMKEVRECRKQKMQEVKRMEKALRLRTVTYKGKTRVLKCCCADAGRWGKDEELARKGILTIHDTDEVGVETPFMKLVEERCTGCDKFYWFTTAGTGKKRELE